MPVCPQCGTWNPDDKNVCWRCQAPLPKPEPVKKKRSSATFWGMPLWVWLVFLAFFLVNLLWPLLGHFLR